MTVAEFEQARFLYRYFMFRWAEFFRSLGAKAEICRGTLFLPDLGLRIVTDESFDSSNLPPFWKKQKSCEKNISP